MKIEKATRKIGDNKGYVIHAVSFIPDDTIINVYLTLDDNAKAKSESFGRINISYIIHNQLLEPYKEWCAIEFEYGDITYIKINDKDKFVIKTIEDVKKLYTYITGCDYDSFIADFNKEDKQNTIDNRKKKLEQDF